MLFLSKASDFCRNTASIWGVIGYLVLILKIVIPLVLIVLGMIDLGKAVIASDDKAISKSVNMLLHRFIAAVIIFFIPSIISALFNAFVGINLANDNIQTCVQCVTNVSSASEDPAYNKCKSDVVVNTDLD